MDVKAMDARLLEVLAGRRVPAPCVSLYLPLGNGADASEQVRATLDVLSRAAAAELSLLGTAPARVLGPLERYTVERQSWPRGARGLGVFAARGMLEAYSLPHQVPALVRVAARFHVRPLLGLSQGDGRFFVLVLGLDHARLLEADRQQIIRVRLPGLPVRFGHDDADSPASTRTWLRGVAQCVDQHVEPTNAPLVLACDRSLHALYRAASRYRHIVDRPAAAHDEAVADHIVREAAWERVEALFSKAPRNASRHYAGRVREGRSAAGLRTVLDAARAGRIETLYLQTGALAWGRCREDGSIDELADAESGAEDLLDRAAGLVIAAGGHVLEFSAADMPTTGSIAATLRF